MREPKVACLHPSEMDWDHRYRVLDSAEVGWDPGPRLWLSAEKTIASKYLSELAKVASKHRSVLATGGMLLVDLVSVFD